MPSKTLLTIITLCIINFTNLQSQLYSTIDSICIANSYSSFSEDENRYILEKLAYQKYRLEFFTDKNGHKVKSRGKYYQIDNRLYDQFIIRDENSETSLVGFVDTSNVLVIPHEYSTASEFRNGFSNVSKNNKRGIIDRTNTIIIPLEYDKLQFIGNSFFKNQNDSLNDDIYNQNKLTISSKYDQKLNIRNSFFIAQKDGKYGLINIKNKLFIPLKYNDLKYIGNSFFRAKNDVKYGVIDMQNNLIIPFEYDEIKSPKEDFFITKKETNWGIINNEGEIIIDFKYKSIQYDKGYFILKSEYNQTIIDTDGKQLFNSPTQIRVKPIKSGYFSVEKNRKYGIMDVNGRLLSGFKWNMPPKEIKNSTNFIINEEGKYGILSNDNKIIMAPKHRSLDSQENFIKGTNSDGSIQLYDHSLNPIHQEPFDEIKKFGPRNLFLLAKRDYRISVLNHKGENIYKRTFLEVKDIREGLLLGKTKAGWNYYSVFDGSIKCKGPYKEADPFFNQTAFVQVDNNMYLIDSGGNYKSKPYDQIIRKYDHYIIRSDNRWGLIDKEDNVVLETEYSKITSPINLNIYKLEKDGSSGIFDGSNIVLPIEYDNIFLEKYYHSKKVILIKKNRKYGFATIKGKICLATTFDEISDFYGTDNSNNIFKTKQDGLYGLYVVDRNQRVEAVYNKIKKYLDSDMMAVKLINKWGFLNTKGQLLIVPKYDEIKPFNKKGFAFVREGERWSMIDKKDSVQISYDNVKQIENYYIVQRDSLYGVLSKEGKVLIKPKFSFLKSTNFENYFIAENSNKLGLLSKDGKVIMDFKYKDISTSKDGVIGVTENYFDVVSYKGVSILEHISGEFIHSNLGWFIFSSLQDRKVHAISKSGNIIGKNKNFTSIKPMYGSGKLKTLLKFSHVGGTGLMDESENVLVNTIYDDIQPIKPKYYKDGISFYKIMIKTDGKRKYGLVDTLGMEIVPPIYSWVDSYMYGDMISVRDDSGKCGYISLDGKLAVDCLYSECETFKDGFAVVKKRKSRTKYYLEGLVDQDGNVIIPLVYESVSSFFTKKKGVYDVRYKKNKFKINLKGECLESCPEEEILKELSLKMRD